jgi:hypothetical protein
VFPARRDLFFEITQDVGMLAHAIDQHALCRR